MGYEATLSPLIFPEKKLPVETPESYKELQPGDEPQAPVAGVPHSVVPDDDDVSDPSEPSPAIEPVLRAAPETVKSVTGERVKTETSWWRREAAQFAKPAELEKSFTKGALGMIPSAIMGIEAQRKWVQIAETVGLGEIDMMNFKALEPTLRIALDNPDKDAREASRQRILETLRSGRMQLLPEAGSFLNAGAPDMVGVFGDSEAFVNQAFDDATFLPRMRLRSKYRYDPFTDPVMQVAFEMQEKIEAGYPQDVEFVGSWADALFGSGGSLSMFAATRKAGGQGGLAGFAYYAGAGQFYEAALKAGASQEIAFKAASIGGLVGLTDMIPVERLISSPKVTRALFALAISAGRQAIAEGGQEALQQYMQNVTAKILYNSNQSLTEGVWENFALGVILGASSDVATGGFRKELEATPPPQPAPSAGPVAGAVPPATVPGAPAAGTVATTEEADVDPLLAPTGDWRNATVKATMEDGTTVDLKAGEAIDFLSKRRSSIASFKGCMNAA